LSFFYLAEIQLCKIKAESYADDVRAISGKKLISFSSEAKGIELVDDDEIFAGGKMYDIVKTQTRNGVIWYYTFSDSDEDEYVNKLTNLEKNNLDERSLSGKTIKLYEAKYFTFKNRAHAICVSSDQLPEVKILNDSFLYSSIYKDVLSPPPDHLPS
jgi:hypothetical protein